MSGERTGENTEKGPIIILVENPGNSPKHATLQREVSTKVGASGGIDSKLSFQA